MNNISRILYVIQCEINNINEKPKIKFLFTKLLLKLHFYAHYKF